MSVMIKGANVYRNGKFERLDVLVDDSKTICLFPSNEKSNTYIFPGFIDAHVHLREPGFSYKEDIFTGTRAAAHGGYTDICSMPNLSPVPDSVENLKIEQAAINEKAIINVHPYGSITKQSMGEKLSDMEELSDRVVAFSDDGKGVASDEVMEEAFILAKKLGKVISAHCEFKELMGGAHVNEGPAAKMLGIKGISAESEWKMIERDIKLAKKTGAAYHVCHVSTKKSIELIREAKKQGVNVTCETAPHYLVLDENDLVKFLQNGSKENEYLIEADYKMNPPLRSSEDRLALIEALRDGTIDMIATDHAPHSAEEKARGIQGAPMGIVGLECAFPILYTELVEKGVITLEKLVELLTKNPGERFGIKTGIEAGEDANLTVFDLEESFKINPEEFLSKGKSTPFKGRTVRGKCLMTICNGEVVYRNPDYRE